MPASLGSARQTGPASKQASKAGQATQPSKPASGARPLGQLVSNRLAFVGWFLVCSFRLAVFFLLRSAEDMRLSVGYLRALCSRTCAPSSSASDIRCVAACSCSLLVPPHFCCGVVLLSTLGTCLFFTRVRLRWFTSGPWHLRARCRATCNPACLSP